MVVVVYVLALLFASFMAGGQYFCEAGNGTVVKGHGCVQMEKVKYYECDGRKFEIDSDMYKLTLVEDNGTTKEVPGTWRLNFPGK